MIKKNYCSAVFNYNFLSFWIFSVFREVVECEEFLTLSHHQVSKLICSDRLTVPSEEKVGFCEILFINFLSNYVNNSTYLFKSVVGI